jgi:hypothetical protein
MIGYTFEKSGILEPMKVSGPKWKHVGITAMRDLSLRWGARTVKKNAEMIREVQIVEHIKVT